MRDIARHVEEFVSAAKPKPTRSRRHAVDHCCLLFVHEHAEANEHKNNGPADRCRHANKMRTGTHTETTGVIGDLFLAVADDVFGVPMKEFPSANRKLSCVTG
jgi:hypothetical protein